MPTPALYSRFDTDAVSETGPNPTFGGDTAATYGGAPIATSYGSAHLTGSSGSVSLGSNLTVFARLRWRDGGTTDGVFLQGYGTVSGDDYGYFLDARLDGTTLTVRGSHQRTSSGGTVLVSDGTTTLVSEAATGDLAVALSYDGTTARVWRAAPGLGGSVTTATTPAVSGLSGIAKLGSRIFTTDYYSGGYYGITTVTDLNVDVADVTAWSGALTGADLDAWHLSGTDGAVQTDVFARVAGVARPVLARGGGAGRPVRRWAP